MTQIFEMKNTHYLKTDTKVFQDVLDRNKTFEIRFNDRDFQVGDGILLKETQFTGEQIESGQPLIFTGREIHKRISYLLSGYGLQDGWVILGIVDESGQQSQQAEVDGLTIKLNGTNERAMSLLNHKNRMVDKMQAEIDSLNKNIEALHVEIGRIQKEYQGMFEGVQGRQKTIDELQAKYDELNNRATGIALDQMTTTKLNYELQGWIDKAIERAGHAYIGYSMLSRQFDDVINILKGNKDEN